MAQEKIEQVEQVDASKRMFFRGAAALVGAVTAASAVKAVSNTPKESEEPEVKARYAKEALRQERVMLQKKYVVMTDAEKQQMLDEILKNHYKQLA